jgi:transcriptional regulator with XRE-family HTH domain
MLTEEHKTEVSKKLAHRIRMMRLEHRWSQDVLAELSGLHRNYIGNVERAEVNMRLTNIEKIAKAFEVSISELMEGI